MNFGLVIPKYVNTGQQYNFYTGLAIISSCMKQHGLNVFCLNPNHDCVDFEQQLSDFITINNINTICTGGMSKNFKEINEVLEISKKINPNIINIVGGTLITSNPKVILSNIKNIDYGVIGEGEETIIEIADALINGQDASDIKGLAYFKGNEYIVTASRSPIANLDAIPFPDYEAFKYNEYIKLFDHHMSDYVTLTLVDHARFGNILGSRSCPYSCTFCYHSLGKKYRQRSLDSIFKELDYLVENYNINVLALTDDLFSFDKIRMLEFANRIKPYNIKWWASFRVPDIDVHTLIVMKDSGMISVCLGIESFNDKILSSMKKHTTKTQVETALKLVHEGKLSIQGNLIFGDPEENEETIKETVDFLNTHTEYGLIQSMLGVYPYSEIYQLAVERGKIKDEFQYMKDGFPLINLTKLSDKRYNELTIFVENFLKKPSRFLLGKVISSTGKDFFDIEVECPHCHFVNEYKSITQKSFASYFTFICKDCHVTLNVENLKIFSINYTLKDKIISIIIKNIRGNVEDNYFISLIYKLLRYLKRHGIIPTSKYIG